jgi:hypothetical protein
MKDPVKPKKNGRTSDSTMLVKTKKKVEKLSNKKPKTSLGRGINTMRTMAARTKLEKQEEALKSKKK